MNALIEINKVKMAFPVTGGAFQRVKGHVNAVNNVSLAIERGRTLGVVGESGCGKSTLARIVVGLYAPTDGDIIFDGKQIAGPGMGVDFATSRRIQIVFQDPYSSLDPRLPIGDSIAEGLVIHDIGDKTERRKAVADMLELVGLPPQAADRFPHEFSGGQRQRIGIARALIMKPEFLVCDEPTSALDVSVQAQILNLLKRLKSQLNLTMMFISHNLAVVRHIADDVMVMYLGRAVEIGPVNKIFANPQHPYTKALLSATLIADPDRRGERIKLTGELPSPLKPPSGCPFHPRCTLANDRCRADMPGLTERDGVRVACHAVEEGRA
ncbi:ABC transporter ATP-binding protein [Allorhizobium taibaishanense]|uniref:Peptide ABC transporter ATP-binding protein n=1 Tax=Allorhizobium taibaishanense TaxID=887144 RepID=A0A1Q9A706_9HYPH|nr:dipeptide ABC transporter ATP-binding protein [Allorhizobium taibaishanense]MBB4008471.1 oligopeptide/dipeptide ABC transporter ATP-binding protein [Allorhizobium taibaishanense]OLP50362.1 peptide ABC transporter ATP-binding protein [Allorhizobium taibaishanense]